MANIWAVRTTLSTSPNVSSRSRPRSANKNPTILSDTSTKSHETRRTRPFSQVISSPENLVQPSLHANYTDSSNLRSKSFSPTKKMSTSDYRIETESANIESQYVKNLQQQIYLLELETRYLRGNKKAPSYNNVDHERDAESDLGSNHVDNNLSISKEPTTAKLPSNKQNSIIKSYEANVKELKESEKHRQILEDSLESMKAIQSQLETDQHRLSTELTEQRSELTSKLSSLQTINIQLEQQLNILKCDKQRSALSYDRLSEEKSKMALTVEDLKYQISTLTNTCQIQQDLNQKVSKDIETVRQENWLLQNKMDEQENNLQLLDMKALEKSLKELQEEKKELLIKLKSAQSSLSYSDSIRQKAMDDLTETIRNNSLLQAEMEEWRRRFQREADKWTSKEERQRKLDGPGRDALVDKTHKLEIQVEKERALKEKALTQEQSLQQNYASLEKDLSKVMDQYHMQTEEFNDIKTQMGELNEKLSPLQLTNRELENEVKRLNQSIHQKDSSLDELKKGFTTMKVENAKLTKNLAIKHDLESVKLADFKSLMSTSNTVTSAIKTLMDHMETPLRDQLEDGH